MTGTRIAAPLLRTLLLALLCQMLAGCVGISMRHETSLPKVPDTNTETGTTEMAALPVPVAFIVHLKGRHLMSFGEDVNFYSWLEARAWVSALSRITAQEHILIAEQDKQPEFAPEFAEFCRTHPVVDIVPIWDREAATVLKRLGFAGASVVGILTLGLAPLPAVAPYRAQFTLTLPGSPADAVPSGQDYAFERRRTFMPLYLIPSGDQYDLFFLGSRAGQWDRTDWRAEEKRRLLAQYLRDIRPRLEQYARQAGQQTGAR